MEILFWAALAFLVLSTVAGTAFVGVRAWRAWNAFVSLAAAGGAGAEQLLTRAEQLAERGERAAVRSEDLLTAVGRLEHSLGRGRVLLGAVGEAQDLLRAVRGIVPRK
jgi:hypothetical protein